MLSKQAYFIILLSFFFLSCGQAPAPSEEVTKFSTARGKWTAKKLFCIQKQRTEKTLPMAMSLIITDRTISAVLMIDDCTAQWGGPIKSLTQTTLEVEKRQHTCSSHCDSRFCWRSKYEEFGYSIGAQTFVLIQKDFSEECRRGEIYFIHN